jgi:flagellar biosynthesis/type III secretory pathway ATPase
VGAYQKGADALLDRAILSLPAINAFLQQKKTDVAPISQTLAALLSLPT